MVSLWRLLTLISACMPLPGAILAAMLGKCGPGGYLAAIVIGLIFGIFNRWGMRLVHARLREMSPSGLRFLPVFYCAALLWAYCSAFLSYWSMHTLLSRS